MSKSTSRIALMAVLGLLTILAAVLVRSAVSKTAPSPVKATETAEQIAAEKEIVRLHDAARANPGNKQARWDLANLYLKYNMIDRAAEQLTAIVNMDHDDLEAELKLASICLGTQQYSDAEFYFRDSVKKSPRSVTGWQGLGSALIKEHRFYEAVSAAKRALAVNSKDPESLLLHATAQLDFVMQFNDPMSHPRELLTAHGELEYLTKMMPESGEVYYQYGRSEMGLAHRQEAIRQFQHAHQLEPNDADISQLLAVSYRFVQQDEKSLKTLQEAALAHPDHPGINDMLGRLLMDSKQAGAHDLAIAAFERAVNAAPNDPNFAEHLAGAYDKLHDLNNARKYYERAAQLNPYRSAPFQKLAVLYTRLGEPKLAKQAAILAEQADLTEQELGRLMDMSGKRPDDVKLHLMLADKYRDLKMSGPARDEYLLVLKLDPANKSVPKEYLSTYKANTSKP